VLDLMRSIAAAIEAAATRPGASAFLLNQISVVEEEYEREPPDEDVVAASIGGVVLLARRLGGQVVAPQLVRELASLSPGAVRGRE
jgi:hypothetical protein